MRWVPFLIVLVAAFAPAAAQAQAGGGAVEREVIVRYRAGATASERSATRLESATRVVRDLRLARTQLLRVREGESVGTAIQALKSDPEVAYAVRNGLLHATATPNDPLFGSLWGLARIGAGPAWDLTTGSPGVVVGVVDSGVAWDHPDLAPNIFTNPREAANGVDDDGNGLVDDVRGWDFVGGDADPRDLSEHGTHVAGTIAAAGNNGLGVTGVGWTTKILPARALDGAGTGSFDVIQDAFDYAADMGARIVNASLSGRDVAAEVVLGAAIDAHPDTLFVVAAGNDGTDNDALDAFPCNIAAPNLICVAATDQSDALAGFSNFGATSVDLGAPGTSILSTRPSRIELLTEGFEGGAAGWTPGGSAIWSRTSAAAATGSFSITDSDGGSYANGANAWIASPPIDLSGQAGCHLDFMLRLNVQAPVDGVLVDSSTDGGASWTRLDSYSFDTGTAFVPISLYLDADGSATARFRFRLVSNAAVTGDGAYVDDVVVRCLGATYGAGDYQVLDGTSMATPHVSGVAALMLAREPSASVAKLRDVLLTSGDPVPGLAGLTVTGRRLNAARAVAAMGAAPPAPAPPSSPAPLRAPSAGRGVTLADVRAVGCRRSGRGRRAKVSCRLTHAAVIRRVTASIKRRAARRPIKRVTLRRLGSRGRVTIRVRRALSGGRYVLTFRLTAHDGTRRAFRKRLRL